MLLVAFEDGQSVVAGGLRRDDDGFGLLHLRVALQQNSSGVGVMEAGDDMSGFDPLAFLQRNLDDFAGDFGGDGRAAPCEHVAIGVAQRCCDLPE